MPKLKLLILDAGVVIRLHELGLWDRVRDQCDIHLSRIVAEKEVLFQPGDEGEYGDDIDLSSDISNGEVQLFDVTAGELKAFRDQFDSLYLGDLDDGEAESLTYLMKQADDFLISSGDAIVYRVLGNLGRREQGFRYKRFCKRPGSGENSNGRIPEPFERNTRRTARPT